MFLNEISLCVVLLQFLYFGSHFNSFIAIVNEFHENVLDVRLEELKIDDNWVKSVHLLLETSPNLFFFSRQLFQLALTKNTDARNSLNKLIFRGKSLPEF